MFEFVDKATPDIKDKIYKTDSAYDIWEMVRCATNSRKEANRAQDACCKLKAGESFSTEFYTVQRI